MARLDSRHPTSGTDKKAFVPANGSIAVLPPATAGSRTPQVHERRLQKVLEHIHSHLPHSVRELAQAVHLSPTHLQRLFKQETGVHLSDLLCERRLQVAAGLLCSTDKEIKEIAYLVGYGHHSSFVRAFQRRFRVSPKRYRQQSAA